MARGQRGRELARLELAFAGIMGFVVAPFLYVAAPGTLEPMFYTTPWQETALLVVGAAGLLIGFLWMVRIYRTNPEPDQEAWRYREQRLTSRPTQQYVRVEGQQKNP